MCTGNGTRSMIAGGGVRGAALLSNIEVIFGPPAGCDDSVLNRESVWLGVSLADDKG